MAEKCLYADHHTTSHGCRIFLLYIFGLIIKSIYDKRYFPLSILPLIQLYYIMLAHAKYYILSSVPLNYLLPFKTQSIK